jgi:signal transduction histidine kinase
MTEGDTGLRTVPRSVLGRIVLVCGAVVSGAGALSLVGWVTGRGELTALGKGYIPVAPNTALLFTLLGSAVLVRETLPESRAIRHGVVAAAAFSVFLAGGTLIGFAIGHDLKLDDWFFRTTRMLGETPIGRMSPVTASCFVLAGASLLLSGSQTRARAAIPGIVIALVGAVVAMGYWYGAPLLYGGTVIPVALPTSLALMALGVALVASAGPRSWPLNMLIGPSTRARLLRVLPPTVVLLLLLEDRISSSLFGHNDSGIVLGSAVTAVLFLLIIGFVVARLSHVIGSAADRGERELNDAVSQRIQAEQELQASFNDLRKSAEQRRLLLGQLVSAQEEERARISGDLHDDSIQKMTAAELRLQMLRRSVGPSLEPEVDRVLAIVSTAARRLRSLMVELHPRALERDGLEAALREHLALATQGEWTYSLESHLSREPDGEARRIAYRIALEALTNVRKHSQADQVRVSLRDQGTGFAVTICDDGIGIRPEDISQPAPGHIGLSSMRERAVMARGWFKIGPAKEQGTIVEFGLPYEANTVPSDTELAPSAGGL